MNDLEKKSFYSFLGLYVVSSFLFIALVGFWYYKAQKHALENETYYKLEHLADKKAGEIVMAHMQGSATREISVPEDIKLALIDSKGNVVEGNLVEPDIKIKPGYFTLNGYNILISDAPREHLNISYVVVQSNRLNEKVQALKESVWILSVFAFLVIIIIAWVLSKIFMKPLNKRVMQIERFINDVTHELNTPITSLSMSTDQVLKAGECTPKTLNNISISTKQLYDIYRSLTYLNFNHKEEISEPLDLKEVLEKSIEYYRPLAEIKRIDFEVDLEETRCIITTSQLTLLLGNLIGNAIKYSSPRSTITISLKNRVLKIIDEGIGIDQTKQKEIFEKFKRGTDYSGGFGVGLSIVKSICDEYNIKIELDSLLEKGTEFRLYL
ncbi:MAG: two-component sensor histidine kinase [Sulfurovum sp.]|nr:MAG: two-component sensor histidine kinase [Sulfurovum sp.]